MYISLLFSTVCFTSQIHVHEPFLSLFLLEYELGALVLEHIELPAKLLDYFFRINKSNINQLNGIVPASNA